MLETETQKVTYQVSGMHCPACELYIEKQVGKLPGVTGVAASNRRGCVTILCTGEVPAPARLNKLLARGGYTVADTPVVDEAPSGAGALPTVLLVAGAAAFWLLLDRLGVTSLVNVSDRSTLPAFFALGIVAGLSSCAALVGGIILSMSAQWLSLYTPGDSTSRKLEPHLLFNAGRVASFGLLGAVLGLVGQRLQLSLGAGAFVVVAVSLLMIVLGLQMLGVGPFRHFRLALPRSFTARLADEGNFSGRYMPALMGAATFFLPCGFTLTAQSVALLSGSPLQGGLIMLAFVLGTTPMLLGIGFSSIKLQEHRVFSEWFPRAAGALVLLFALFNINSQFNVLGIHTPWDAAPRPAAPAVSPEERLVPTLVDGVQVIKMNASSSAYTPNYFKVKAGMPVRWEITDKGTSACTNAVVAPSFFSGEIRLTPGTTSVKQFTPATVRAGTEDAGARGE